MSNEEKFIQFLKLIQIPDHQDLQAQEWTRKIKEGIEKKAKNEIEKVFLSGSVKRRTTVKPLHDVDLYVVVNDSLISGKDFSTKLKDHFQSIVQSVFEQKTKFPFMDHGLKITKGDFQADLVIARKFKDDDNVYQVLNNNDWLKTSTINHEQRLKDINKTTNGRATEYIKLLKYWNKKKKKPMNSFHLEVLVLDCLPKDNGKFKIGLPILFNNLSEAVKEKKPHYLKDAPIIDEMTEDERTKAMKLLKQSFIQSKNKNWIFVFGKEFSPKSKGNPTKKKKKDDFGNLDGDDPYMFIGDD